MTNAHLRKTTEAVADAAASIKLSPDDSRQVYNAARVYCQAAACLESSPEKNHAMLASAERYRAEALRAAVSSHRPLSFRRSIRVLERVRPQGYLA